MSKGENLDKMVSESIKGKGDELINKFYNEPNAVKGEGLLTWAVNNKQSAVALAVIAVEEIIEESKKQAVDFKDDFRLLYWQQVLGYLRSGL